MRKSVRSSNRVKVRRKLSKTFLAGTLVLGSSVASAHFGWPDSSGGHEDDNGVYHCHTSACKIEKKYSSTLRARQKSREQAKKKDSPAMAEKVKSSEPKSARKYDRESWKHWQDYDKDCKNTRHELLESRSTGRVFYSSSGCTVTTGEWWDKYSGRVMYYARDLDVDHVIPLKWAHDHGGNMWDSVKKEKFANDINNLLIVDDGLNRQKGAKGPTKWLPPNHAYRCEYLKKWSDVLTAYPSLKMTSREERVFKRQREACAKTVAMREQFGMEFEIRLEHGDT